MRIFEIRLTSFRNFNRKVFELDPGFNLVIGKNARGKTNLLEALYILTTGRSPRSISLKETVSFGCEIARLEATSEVEGRSTALEVVILANGRCSFKVNGVRYERKRSPIKTPAVMFSPDHLRMIKGYPEERREFMDAVLSQINPVYAHNRSLYRRILRERNVALQKVASGAMSQKVVDVFDDQLIAAGSSVISERQELVEKIQGLASAHYKALAFGRLGIEYRSQIEPTGDIEGAFRERLLQRRTAELARGTTLIGPHRDDLEITLDGIEMRAYASQGEQRSACLSMKMAEMDVLENTFHVKPLVLLDDVMSELDESRRRSLMEKVLSGGQTLISSTNKEYFSLDELGKAMVIDLG